MDNSAPLVYEAVTQFLANLPQENKASYEGELNKFMRWFGGDRNVSEITARDVESYQEDITTQRGANTERRLRPIKEFLAFSYSQKWLYENVSKYIRLKRVAGTSRRTTASAAAAAAAAAPLQEQREQITREGYEQLKEELSHLITVERPSVSAAILEARRDRDIRENAGFAAAKEHQSHIETRIQQLQQQLANVDIIGEDGVKADRSRVMIGATVTMRELDTDDVVEYTLVSPMEASVRTGKISVASPVGKALLDSRLGDEVDVEAPVGTIKYRIEKIDYNNAK